MKIKVSETVETEWEIAEELSYNHAIDGQSVGFYGKGCGSFWFAGEWLSAHPTNPQLRAAVERQWYKLRPLAENEWRSDLGAIAVFQSVGGVPVWKWLSEPSEMFQIARAEDGHEKHYGNTVNGYTFRMGEFGVEWSCGDGTWWLATSKNATNAAREWMRRKGIKLGAS